MKNKLKEPICNIKDTLLSENQSNIKYKEPIDPFQRDISPNEWLYLAGQSIAPPFAIQIFIEGKGDLDINKLRWAVKMASDACPGSRLSIKGKKWIDNMQTPPVCEIDRGTFDGFKFNQLPFLKQELDYNQGPTCEVVVIRGNPTTIVFRVFHGVMDARGVLLWIKNVFLALREEPLLEANSTYTDIDLLKSLRPVKLKKNLKMNCPSPLGYMKADKTKFKWKRYILPGNYPGLVARILSYISDMSGENWSRFMIPVDMRRHYESLLSTANLSLPIFLEVKKGDDWVAVHERLLAALAGKQELAQKPIKSILHIPPRPLAAIINLFGKYQNLRDKFYASALVSNLGNIKLEEFSTLSFTASTVYSLPVHAPILPLSLVAVECPDHVELTLAYPSGKDMDEKVESLLHKVQDTIAGGNVRDWCGNRTDVLLPAGSSVLLLFSEQAAAVPNAIALICNGKKVTYHQLDHNSNVVADLLRKKNIGQGDIVGILADRTEHALIAIWGILKAGAAYLPIDPQYPKERIAYILNDSKTSMCLIENRYANELAGIFSRTIQVLEEIDYTIVPSKGKSIAEPEDLAYIIYTSGSTGKPKGVQIEHRNLTNYICWAKKAYKVDETTCFALFTSLSFDLSVTSIFLPLISGGSVMLFPEEINHVTLRTILECSDVNALKLTPTHLELISCLNLTPSGFRTIIVGGEQLKSKVASKSQEIFGSHCRIINEYGPTEATVGCIYHEFDQVKDGSMPAVPIGIPIDNTKIYLLDGKQNFVGFGETGEIYITGNGIARSYLNREDLTDEKFVILSDGTRAYRSGDLARIPPEGTLEFLGRVDDQIKINGHRIEPGEIEAVLKEHPDIKSAVVLGNACLNRNEKVLCAYYVAASKVDEDEIRTYLKKRLPRHMVPSFIAAIDKIPFTANGKIDVKALSYPTSTRIPVEDVCLVRDEIEGKILDIWSEILKLDTRNLGPEADFYRLGGDSLKMIEMLSAVVKKVVGTERENIFMISIRPVIKKPTLENICHIVKSIRRQ